MGVPPEVWGPTLWGALHTWALAGTLDEDLVAQFAKGIPCPACSSHFDRLLNEYPIPSQELFEWTVMLHNKVNERTGKPVFTVDQARERWTTKPQTTSSFPYLILLFILVILILWVRCIK